MGMFDDAWNNIKKDLDVVKKKGFKPQDAAADEAVKSNEERHGTQLQEDMKLTPEERAEKARKGFLKKVEE